MNDLIGKEDDYSEEEEYDSERAAAARDGSNPELVEETSRNGAIADRSNLQNVGYWQCDRHTIHVYFCNQFQYRYWFVGHF